MKKKGDGNVNFRNVWSLVRLLLVFVIVMFALCRSYETKAPNYEDQGNVTDIINLENIPEYSGYPWVVLNGNIPYFTEEEKAIDTVFETYPELDSLGRCGSTFALVGIETMPTEERESISSVKPTGWKNHSYDIVEGGYVYNRCHLIGFQLTGENANERNLITGTRYLNIDGMLDNENEVADYVASTGNHVLYRVTPVFEGDELVARGVLMEAWSLEDEGKGVQFCIYAYNVQPGIVIDYATGENWLEE